MRHTVSIVLAYLAINSLGMVHADPPAQAAPDADAAQVYGRAADMFVADSSASQPDLTHFQQYPPYAPEQMTLFKYEWDSSPQARALLRSARTIDHAKFDPQLGPMQSFTRSLASRMTDFAMYTDAIGDDAESIEQIRDLLHMSDLMIHQDDPAVTQVLMGISMRSMAVVRLMVTISGAKITNDPSDKRDIQASVARQLMTELANSPDLGDMDVQYRARPAGGLGGAAPGEPIKLREAGRVAQLLDRERSDCFVGAVSIACHLYQFEHQRWPNSLNELVPAYLSQAPIDPCGDGNQPIGYALIKGGLPDGSDRPLVYYRERADDGLFFCADAPQYTWTFGDFTDNAAGLQKHGGQFRDVTRWKATGRRFGSTTRPLPDSN